MRRASSLPSRRLTAPPPLSLPTTRPVTVTSPVGAAGTCGWTVAPAPGTGGIQPRSTSTAVPSASTSGVSTSKPTLRSSVRPRTRTVFAPSYRPVAVTRLQVSSSDGAGPTSPPLGAGSASRSGAGVMVAPASIRSLTAVRPR